jgi:hypothetical protein
VGARLASDLAAEGHSNVAICGILGVDEGALWNDRALVVFGVRAGGRLRYTLQPQLAQGIVSSHKMIAGGKAEVQG